LREERKLRLFENRVLRRIFGPKRDDVTGEWRKLHNEKISTLYSSPNIIRVIKSRMSWVGNVARMWERRTVYRVLVGKPEGRRPLGRLRRRWIILRSSRSGVWGYGLDRKAQDRYKWRGLVTAVMNLRVPQNSGNFLTS
jgi:hypothetical protein